MTDHSIMWCSSVCHKVVITGLHVILLASLLSPSQCLVRLTVITQKQIFSSENKVTHFSSCGMCNEHARISSHLHVFACCYYLSLFLQTWAKRIQTSQNVADQFLTHCLALAWAWLNVRASILTSLRVSFDQNVRTLELMCIWQS